MHGFIVNYVTPWFQLNIKKLVDNLQLKYAGYIDRVSSQHVVVAGLPRATENIIERSIKV